MQTPESELNFKTFTKFHGKHSGKTGVIVGTGPTMKRYKPIQGAVHFGVNESVMHFGSALDYLFVQDVKPGFKFGYHGNSKPYDAFGNVKFAGRCPLIETVTSISDSKVEEYGWLPYEVGVEGACEWTTTPDTERLGDGQSVSFSAAQVALFMGVSMLYLVGMDISTGSTAHEDNPHGANAYKLFRHKERWEHFGDWAKTEYPAVNIASINPVGLKGVFVDIET